MAILFDNDRKAIIEPDKTVRSASNFPHGKIFPKIAVSCFSNKLFKTLIETYPSEHLFKVKNASSSFSVYELSINDTKIIAYHSAVGAPACISVFEEIIALGVKNFFVFGTCGVLSKNILDCSIIIPTTSIREEGTSYHYMEDSEEIEMDSTFMLDFEKHLAENNIYYLKGKNWTTDAFFRETRGKVELFKSKGVISVDMEASAMSAVAKFRGVNLLHFFYSADNLDADEWEERSLYCSHKLEEKSKIWELLLDFILKIKDKL